VICTDSAIGLPLLAAPAALPELAAAVSTVNGCGGGAGIARSKKACHSAKSGSPSVWSPSACRYAASAALYAALSLPSVGPS
jgi:hypothetical protein